MDLCIKLEKITNRTFALNWKKIVIKKQKKMNKKKKMEKSKN